MSNPKEGAKPTLLLLIEDDEVSREVMQLTLGMHGFSVAVAEDGAAAMKLLEDGLQPGAILMDTQMPGLSGVALIEALRSVSMAPIVAISASEPGKAIREAADGFLLKPIEAEELAALLAAANKPVTRERPFETRNELRNEPENTSGSADGGLIDPVVFGKLMAMMPASAVKEIYAASAVDLDTRLVALEAAMEVANAPEVARIAHSIKGGCGMIGLSGAKDAASRLEMSNLPETWPAELAQLRIALRGLEGMLADDFPV